MSLHELPKPEWLNASYLQNLLNLILKNEDTTLNHFEVTPGSSFGDNYVCQLFRIKFEFGSNNESITLIGKIKPETKLGEKLENVLDIFEAEAKFFSDVLMRLNDFGKLPREIAPKLYHIDHDRRVIFMEDLKDSQFFLQQRGSFLTREQAKLVVERLALLHGKSYHLLQKDPSYKKLFPGKFWSSEANPAIKSFFGNGLRALAKYVDTYGLSEEMANKLKEFPKIVERDWLKVCDLQDDKLNFLVHGDCWMNNMMFHSSNDVVDDVRLIDFQIVSYNCFANDLQYFIFTSVDADVIVNDLEYLLECYYKVLIEVAPMIPNLTLSRILKEFSERYFFGLCFAIIFRAFVVCDDKPDVDKVMEGKDHEMGFGTEIYAKELKKLLPIFLNAGAL